MNVNPKSRLASFIAAAIDDDGNVDRARLYESLMLDPTDPVAQLVEIFIATTNAQKDIENAFGRQKEQAEGTFLTCVTQISDDCNVLRGAIEKSVDELAKQRSALNTDKEAAIERYGDLLNQLTRVQGSVQATAKSLEGVAASSRRTSLLGAAAIGCVIGAIGMLAAVHYFR